jgi:hypothetical protein
MNSDLWRRYRILRIALLRMLRKVCLEGCTGDDIGKIDVEVVVPFKVVSYCLSSRDRFPNRCFLLH